MTQSSAWETAPEAGKEGSRDRSAGYRQRLVRAQPDDTVVSLLFTRSTGPHCGSEASGRPGKAEIVANYQEQRIQRYADVPPLKGMTGALDLLQMPAGQGVGAIATARPAGELIQELSD